MGQKSFKSHVRSTSPQTIDKTQYNRQYICTNDVYRDNNNNQKIKDVLNI